MQDTLPNLLRRSSSGPVFLLGGVAEKKLLDNLPIPVAWQEFRGYNAQALSGFFRRVEAGKVGAVILLRGLVSHTVSYEAVEACKRGKVPFYSVRIPSRGQLRMAFTELERRLEKCHE